MIKKPLLLLPLIVILSLMFFYSVSAYALPMDTNAPSMDTNVFDGILTKYETAAKKWEKTMIGYATNLFWGLALISMVWTYGMMILKKADIQEFFAETIRFFCMTGFFWWILTNGPAIGDAIIKSIWQIGVDAIGVNKDFTPGGVVKIGFDIFFKVLDQSSIWSPIDSAVGILISVVILTILTLIGVNLLLLFVSAWILVYGGVFFLGFGGSRWTSDIALNFYKTVLSVAAQLMAMLLLIGIGKTFVSDYYDNMSGGANLKELGIMLVASIMLFYLTNKIPPLIGSIIDGGNFNTSGGGFSGGAAIGSGAGFAMGAASMAAATATTGGSMALAGASNMLSGGASSLQAAFHSAQQQMTPSGSMATSENNAPSNVNSGSGGSNSFSSVMNHAVVENKPVTAKPKETTQQA
ncbi:P-type conjugative transfer protein TrbL [Candidatus Regiella endosymbiont of Tuberolachnus salignus]|uniref:P-type conjugative transfer protein TrbL n=1 Tax=Candidatus Regiella endosymbiont of Tuberolachnus salignus TaxID=3077956 RepID=UPI0030D01804